MIQRIEVKSLAQGYMIGHFFGRTEQLWTFETGKLFLALSIVQVIIKLSLCAKQFLAKLTRKQTVVDTLGPFPVPVKTILSVKSFAAWVRTFECLFLFHYIGLFKVICYMMTAFTHPMRVGTTDVTSNVCKGEIVSAELTFLSHNLGTGENIPRWSHRGGYCRAVIHLHWGA